MDKSEAHILAQTELNAIQAAGYGIASQHVETVQLKEVSAASGTHYQVEVSYLWQNANHDSILVICRINSKTWFEHQQLEESITLSSRKD